MLAWAEQMFDCFGPLNDRARDAFPVLQEMMQYATAHAVRGNLKAGSWAEGIIDAVDRGEVDQAARPALSSGTEVNHRIRAMKLPVRHDAATDSSYRME